MTDEQFQRKIILAVTAAKYHQMLVKEVEAEYERRFGHNPSDADDDFWIDSIHMGSGGIPTIDQIKENAKLHSPRKWG